MLPLHTHATVSGVSRNGIYKVLTPEEASSSAFDSSDVLVWMEDDKADNQAEFTQTAGFMYAGEATKKPDGAVVIENVRTGGVVAPGDVVAVQKDRSLITVLYRRGSTSNTLFATERCNSFCVMCSQPPREVDDQWRVADMLNTIDLVDRDEPLLGMSGGEPTLLGDDLLVVLNHARRQLPETGMHILSNGRRFVDARFAQTVCGVRHPNVCWGIPLYSASPEIHDYIVQAPGAWDETVAGLFNLARYGASIELRVVVQKANVEALSELAYFIFRNLTFVDHVAFMGLEPMGFARVNRDDVFIDPVDVAPSLQDAVHFLANRGMKTSIFNIPICTLPNDLRPFAVRSISDWKNVYLPVCDGCDVQDECCGFFKSVGVDWLSRSVSPITLTMEAGDERQMA